MARQNKDPKVLDEEARDILLFVSESVMSRPGAQIFMRDLYEAYNYWRQRTCRGETVLSVDSFGRLFPRLDQWKRGVIRQMGVQGKGLIGATIRV